MRQEAGQADARGAQVAGGAETPHGTVPGAVQ